MTCVNALSARTSAGLENRTLFFSLPLLTLSGDLVAVLVVLVADGPVAAVHAVGVVAVDLVGVVQLLLPGAGCEERKEGKGMCSLRVSHILYCLYV